MKCTSLKLNEPSGSVGILGVGHYLPPVQVTNADLIEKYNIRIKASFIQKNIGIETRFFAREDQAVSDLAVEAARRALAASKVPLERISRIILATVSGDFVTPASACVVQHKLGLTGGAALDITAACSGFVYGLDLAARCVATGDDCVLVIGAECRSKQLNFEDKRTVFLYGDGAGAAVVGRVRGPGILSSVLYADGSGAEAVYIPGGGSREALTPEGLAGKRDKITMPNGTVVAENAMRGLPGLATEALKSAGRDQAEVDFYVFHQPNFYLLKAAMERAGVPEEKSWINFPRVGNTTGASIPIALSEAVEAGKIRSGDLVLLCGVGAGFTGGAVLLRWGG